jgi:hypothetical protein
MIGSDQQADWGMTFMASVDMKAHREAYSGFTTLVKWATGIVAVSALIVIFIIG